MAESSEGCAGRNYCNYSNLIRSSERNLHPAEERQGFFCYILTGSVSRYHRVPSWEVRLRNFVEQAAGDFNFPAPAVEAQKSSLHKRVRRMPDKLEDMGMERKTHVGRTAYPEERSIAVRIGT